MELILSIFVNQILLTVGLIAVFGLLIAFCRRMFCRIVGYGGGKILLITGIVGTPIHELSHALMCIIFGHRIEEIKLYQPGSEDGTLGYVNHSFNPRNIYHQIGNFFIGVAPILCGSGVLLLLMYFMVPGVYSAVSGDLQLIAMLPTDFLNFSSYVGYFDLFGRIILHIFDFSNAGNILWWIFIILSLMISSHMELSFADIKGGFKGFIVLSVIILAMDLILGLISAELLTTVNSAITSFSLSMASFLAISGVFSAIMLILALVIRCFRMIIKR